MVKTVNKNYDFVDILCLFWRLRYVSFASSIAFAGIAYLSLALFDGEVENRLSLYPSPDWMIGELTSVPVDSDTDETFPELYGLSSHSLLTNFVMEFKKGTAFYEAMLEAGLLHQKNDQVAMVSQKALQYKVKKGEDAAYVISFLSERKKFKEDLSLLISVLTKINDNMKKDLEKIVKQHGEAHLRLLASNVAEIEQELRAKKSARVEVLVNEEANLAMRLNTPDALGIETSKSQSDEAESNNRMLATKQLEFRVAQVRRTLSAIQNGTSSEFISSDTDLNVARMKLINHQDFFAEPKSSLSILSKDQPLVFYDSAMTLQIERQSRSRTLVFAWLFGLLISPFAYLLREIMVARMVEENPE